MNKLLGMEIIYFGFLCQRNYSCFSFVTHKQVSEYTYYLLVFVSVDIIILQKKIYTGIKVF